MKTNRVSLIIIPVVLIAFIAVALFATQTPARDANAQDTSLSMRSLLERLRARMDADPNFLVHTQFFALHVTVSYQWLLRSNVTEAASTRRFSENGDEYVLLPAVGIRFCLAACGLCRNTSMVI